MPHFKLSVAPFAVERMMERISLNFARVSLGAALIYSVTVVGRGFMLSSFGNVGFAISLKIPYIEDNFFTPPPGRKQNNFDKYQPIG